MKADPRHPKRGGLPQGFVQFGTLAHRILLTMHALGNLRFTDLTTELPEDNPKHVAVALLRMEQFGFIFDAGKLGAYESGERTQTVWSLRKPARRRSYRPATSTERNQRMDARRRVRVSSVFEWRGPPRLAEPAGGSEAA